MKIVFWGTPEYSAQNLISIIKSGYDVIAVVTQPDRKRNRGSKLSPSPVKQVALDYGITTYTTHSISKDDHTRDKICKLNADIYIVVAFGQILPKIILDEPKLGCWNSHASLLPLWRGAAPIQWSIINDDAMTGVCIMYMEQGLDTGPVINQESIQITDNDNLETLTNKLSNISSKLLIQSLKSINLTLGLSKNDRLKKLKSIDQSSLKGTVSYARQLKKKDYLINWNLESRTIYKKVKGLFPNAYSQHKGKRIKIIDLCLCNNVIINNNIYLKNKLLNDLQPGEIIQIKKTVGIFIMTKDFPMLIKTAQLEGKNKTDSYTVALQSKLEEGHILVIE